MNGRSMLLAEKKEVPLQVLVKDPKKFTKVVTRRLSAAYDQALRSLVRKINKQAKEYRGTLRSSDPDKIREWEILENPPDYMAIKFDVKFGVSPKKRYGEYSAKIGDAYNNRGIAGIADVVQRARSEGVKIDVEFKTKVTVNKRYIARIRGEKKGFVKDSVDMLRAGASGQERVRKPFTLDLGNEDAAKLFLVELQNRIGANRVAGRVSLADAMANKSVVPNGHFPLEIKRGNSVVTVRWASWIRQTSLAALIPKLAKARA